ncbi:hypothetical protein ASPWEDRAFT_175663 [Aspergillus wentii DTO 134E9]|uniref:Uncharacterized protein n=1 Tax=Aspergillus wentii DTO 134E9 TaxID=1073089 RepID=A0A1L9RBU4_ASPWE|nr:uncharacterized protein ASPWEDRAFT_175663 [Aspergillus wentii DTO 134E9]OJJ32384.1 hypothetical protein ASPWEDRAFT_175663 [Aspergillus wentii DTO 134E9]
MASSPYSDEIVEDNYYDPWLLEDHPLRSYPTECCPGLLMYLQTWYAAVRKNWGERIFRVVCLLVALQFLAILPYGITYLIPKSNWDQFEEQTYVARWPAELESGDGQSTCLSVNPRAHAGAIQQSIAAGCTGARASAWLHSDELLVGSSLSRLDARHNLNSLYLEPLLEKLETRKANGLDAEGGLFEDPAQSYLLMVDIKSSIEAVWPHLMSQLATLRQKGYLSHMKDNEFVTKPVTVVVTGRAISELEGLENAHNDIFFDASLDDLVLSDSQSDLLERDSNDADESKRAPVQTQENQPSTQQGFYSATANFITTVGFPHQGRFSRQQIELIRAQVQAARQRGFKLRYEGIPRRKGKMRDLIWHVLAREGADLIEVDWNANGKGWWRLFTTGTGSGGKYVL